MLARINGNNISPGRSLVRADNDARRLPDESVVIGIEWRVTCHAGDMLSALVGLKIESISETTIEEFLDNCHHLARVEIIDDWGSIRVRHDGYHLPASTELFPLDTEVILTSTAVLSISEEGGRIGPRAMGELLQRARTLLLK